MNQLSDVGALDDSLSYAQKLRSEQRQGCRGAPRHYRLLLKPIVTKWQVKANSESETHVSRLERHIRFLDHCRCQVRDVSPNEDSLQNTSVLINSSTLLKAPVHSPTFTLLRQPEESFSACG
jgi:hypothetical protein